MMKTGLVLISYCGNLYDSSCWVVPPRLRSQVTHPSPPVVIVTEYYGYFDHWSIQDNLFFQYTSARRNCRLYRFYCLSTSESEKGRFRVYSHRLTVLD